MAERTSPARLKPRPPIVERASPARLAQLVIVVGLALAIPAPAAAHDGENTHVLITFTSEGTYQIDVLNDADWLWLQLAPQTKALPPVAERDRQLTALTGRFTQEIRLTFDDQPVEVGSVEYVPPLDTAPSDGMGWHEPGMMRLGGRVPDGASAFRFAYRLIEDPYPLTILPPQGEAATRWLMTGEVSETFEIAALRPLTRLQVSVQYLGLGFTHILPKGLDHILFIIGLFLLSTKLKPLLWQVTAFTIAHTITLGLAIYGVVSLSPAIVEPLIALSIAYVAVGKPGYDGAETVACRAGLRLRPAAWDGVRRRAGRPRASALRACHRAGHVQRRRRARPALGRGYRLRRRGRHDRPRLVSATGRRACLDGDRGRRHVLDRPTRVVRLTHGHTTYRRPSRSSNSASTARAPPITRLVNTYRRLVNTPPLRPAATAKSIFDPIKQPYRLPRKPRIASQPDSPARMTVGAPTVSQNRYGYGLRRLAIIPVRSDRALGG